MFTEAKSGRLIPTNFSKNHWHCLQLLQQPIYLGVGYESNFVISAMFPMISNVDKLTGSKKNISNILVPSEVLFPGITWITWKYKTHIFVLFFLGVYDGLCLMCSMLFHSWPPCHRENPPRAGNHRPARWGLLWQRNRDKLVHITEFTMATMVPKR